MDIIVDKMFNEDDAKDNVNVTSISSCNELMELIDIDNITSLYDDYPHEFNIFCKDNNLNPPRIKSKRGKALSAMLHNNNKYWNRNKCNEFCNKFNIETKDSIQLFNKHSQWGIMTNRKTEKEKYYIAYPYKLSNKHKIRKNFTSHLNKDELHTEINKIKSTIVHDYIDIPNDSWQIGHKNPESSNNSNNMILQPPIQGRYRDEYIFIDTLTKIPLAHKLKSMLEKKEIELTDKQIDDYMNLFSSLKK